MRSTRWYAGLLAAALLVAPATVRAAGVAPSKPGVGECRRLSAAQAAGASDTSAAIPCSQTHNDRVIAVPKLPHGVTWSDLDTDAKVLEVGIRLCTPPYRNALGQNDRVRDRTAYSYLFFAPTAGQQAKGARWLRCDLVLTHGAKLAPLPTDKEPALTSATPPDKVARCLGGKDVLTTPCTAGHVYRATGTFVVADKSYPGRKALLHAGRSTCPRLVGTDTDFRFTWSPKPVWQLVGDHVVVCYSHTTG